MYADTQPPFQPPGRSAPRSPREVEVALRFGILPELPGPAASWPVATPPAPGTITLVTGPSGAGKTAALAALAAACRGCRCVHLEPFPTDVSILDAVGPGMPLATALAVLSACGLGEPRLWLRSFSLLSQGEQFRARLARAISLHSRRPTGPLLCDEFCTGLHRRAARAVAFNLRKLVTRWRLGLVVATAHDDIAADLRPDLIIRLSGRGPAVTQPGRWPATGGAPVDVRIAAGTLADYYELADRHYRPARRPGCVDRVFVLRETGGDLLGVVVYGHAPLELALRNRATGGRFIRNAGRLNREMRILRRLIIHPDVRGCGLGHRLVRETLPQAGTPYVECLAAMGLVNPVFEKAGMQRIGLCELPPRQERVVGRIRAMGLDPLGPDFVDEVARRPRLRRLVAQAVRGWYEAGTGRGASRVDGQDPFTLARTFRQIAGSRPVYYLWQGDRTGPGDTAAGDEGGRSRTWTADTRPPSTAESLP